MDADQTEGPGSSEAASPHGRAGTLEYGPPRRRRPWRWALAVLGVVILGVSVVGYRFRHPISAKWAQLALERQCLNYTAPADFVVYTDDPAEFAALLNPTVPRRGGRHRQPNDLSFVSFAPDVWVRHPLLRWDPGPAFLHGRKNPRGETRLVGMDLSAMGDEVWFYPRVIVPAGLTTDSRRAKTNKEYAQLPKQRRLHLALGLKKGSATDTVRIFGGQPDPVDPTHFTIGLEVNGVAETLDGWLQDDETVLLKPRDRDGYLHPGGVEAPMWRPAGASDDDAGSEAERRQERLRRAQERRQRRGS